jgi:hypothetical protein
MRRIIITSVFALIASGGVAAANPHPYGHIGFNGGGVSIGVSVGGHPYGSHYAPYARGYDAYGGYRYAYRPYYRYPAYGYRYAPYYAYPRHDYGYRPYHRTYRPYYRPYDRSFARPYYGPYYRHHRW